MWPGAAMPVLSSIPAGGLPTSQAGVYPAAWIGAPRAPMWMDRTLGWSTPGPKALGSPYFKTAYPVEQQSNAQMIIVTCSGL
jgi:hypothetical protein